MPETPSRPTLQRFDPADPPEPIAHGIRGLTDVISAGTPTLTGGFYEVGGEAETFTYSCEELKVVLSGELHVDEEGKEPFVAQPGTVLYIPKDAQITFSSPAGARAFYAAHRLPFPAAATPAG